MTKCGLHITLPTSRQYCKHHLWFWYLQNFLLMLQERYSFVNFIYIWIHTFILYYLSIHFTTLSSDYWSILFVFEPTCWYYTRNSVWGYFLFSQNLNWTSHQCEKYIFVQWRKQNGNCVTLIMLLICFISVLQYLCTIGRSTLCSFLSNRRK